MIVLQKCFKKIKWSWSDIIMFLLFALIMQQKLFTAHGHMHACTCKLHGFAILVTCMCSNSDLYALFVSCSSSYSHACIPLFTYASQHEFALKGMIVAKIFARYDKHTMATLILQSAIVNWTFCTVIHIICFPTWDACKYKPARYHACMPIQYKRYILHIIFYCL